VKIGQDVLHEVQQRLDIEEVVQDYVSLKRKGKNLWACCPFHNEKSPSFSVAPDKGIFKCFGCGKAGDAITFVMEIENLSFTEAIKQLAGKYGIEVPEEAPQPQDLLEQQERESIYLVLKFAAQFYQQQLTEHPDGQSLALSYLKERGLPNSAIEKFELGYSPPEWDGLLSAATKAGYSRQALEKAGLIISKDDGKVYDRFRGRVMFPISSVSGKPIAFGARQLTADKKSPKYINSPETEVYHKSNVLYGIHLAKAAMRRQENCYLVEGYTDVISLHLSDIENVVATSGTSLTEDQIRLIKRYCPQVTVLYDGDPAGLKASLRGIDLLLAQDLQVRVVVFPEGEDPDSYSRKIGSTAFQEYLAAKTTDFVVFKTQLLLKEAGSDPVKRTKAAREVLSSIALLSDSFIRSAYLQECAQLLGMEENALSRELSKILQGKQKEEPKEPKLFQPTKESEPVPAKTTAEDSLKLQERESVRLLIKFGQENLGEVKQYEYLLNLLGDIEFSDPTCRTVLNTLKSGYDNPFKFLINHQDSEVRILVSDLSFEKNHLSPKWFSKYNIITSTENEQIEKNTEYNTLRIKYWLARFFRIQLQNSLKNASSANQETEIQIQDMELKTIESEIGNRLGMVVNGNKNRI
jgi:DNA primase